MTDEQVDFDSIDEAIRQYVKSRDELREAQKIFKQEEKDKKDYLERISMWLRDHADELGVDSFKTASGTAYRSVKRSFRVAADGWDPFLEWMKQTGNYQCLQKRVSKDATQEIYDETDELPPGIDCVTEVGFDVRRPTKSK